MNRKQATSRELRARARFVHVVRACRERLTTRSWKLMAIRRTRSRSDRGVTALVLARHNDGIEVAIEDVSIGGAKLSGPVTLDVGERIQIVFTTNARPVTAEVVRVESRDMTNDCAVVRFAARGDETRAAIRLAIDR